ncbi:hypothetical protein [Lactobacillus taiwanensis]|uniref:hypothetical protein n=1 Tax=Lactobacillus taiwanensis TaxID=508451 RepID=UPI000B9890E9|nr:hypothetical protein [Lactobacillus taiwanensis]OYR95104.1 hypothetical protein CBF51_09035 [Lactobacillus taiwanensis]OYS02501.1 hypothetical protein CBF61_02390 [Lactobacillus taiwanensis]OYS16291.1 hypothetical protein CBF69_02985 [Lactobacillus taiwanensis]OYS32353.1 hypothetical protein CBF85_10580 [Lactobacillus taiwanensis]OYS33121.1 hypothetical protein CBF78_07085 [Lactobacillus taiwanensis]
MKLYGYEVNRFNYRNYSTSQLKEFQIALKSNIRVLKENNQNKEQLDVFDIDRERDMHELVTLIIREISIREK